MYAQSKRSAYPQPTKQQGTRSRNPARNGRKSKPILYRLRKICKRYNWARIGAALLIFGAAASTVWGVSHLLNRGSDTEAAAETRAAEAAVEPEGYIFKYGEGYAVDMEQLTAAWASEAGFEKRYELTDDDRVEIAQVLTADPSPVRWPWPSAYYRHARTPTCGRTKSSACTRIAKDARSPRTRLWKPWRPCLTSGMWRQRSRSNTFMLPP